MFVKGCCDNNATIPTNHFSFDEEYYSSNDWFRHKFAKLSQLGREMWIGSSRESGADSTVVRSIVVACKNSAFAIFPGSILVARQSTLQKRRPTKVRETMNDVANPPEILAK